MQMKSTSLMSLDKNIGSVENKTKSKRENGAAPSIIYFLGLLSTFLLMGSGTGLFGPTLLKFSEQTKSPFDKTIYIAFSRSCGFLFGTIIGGVLIDRFSLYGRTLLAGVILVMTITTVVIPFIYNLIQMIIVHLIWSCTAGLVDNLAQILTIRYYVNVKIDPYLQALHGAFGVGALISPLIIAPFLRPSSPTDQWHYAYWLMGFFHLPSFIWLLVFAVRDEFCSKTTEEVNCENKEFISENGPSESVSQPVKEPESSNSLLTLSLTTACIFFFVGIETAFGGYLHSYAAIKMKFSKDTAAYLNSLFWASFAASRICGIIFSVKFSPVQMLLADLLGCTASIVILFIFHHSSVILWIGSILFGFSVGSIYPSAIAFTEREISLTGRRMSVLAVGGSLGDAAIPLLIGHTMNPKLIGPISFILITFIVVLSASLLMVCDMLYARYRSKGKHARNQKINETH